MVEGAARREPRYLFDYTRAALHRSCCYPVCVNWFTPRLIAQRYPTLEIAACRKCRRGLYARSELVVPAFPIAAVILSRSDKQRVAAPIALTCPCWVFPAMVGGNDGLAWGQVYSRISGQSSPAEGSARSVAERFGTSVSFVVKARRQRLARTGEVSARPQCSHTPRVLEALHDAIAAQVGHEPDVTLNDSASAAGAP